MKLVASAVLLCCVAYGARHAIMLRSHPQAATATAAAPAAPATPPAASQPVDGATVYPSGLPMGIFGSSYALNQPIDQLPVDTRLIATGFGAQLRVTSSGTVNTQVQTGSPEGSSIYGLVVTPNIPITVVNSAQHPEQMVNVMYAPDAYVDESDSVDPTYTGPGGRKRTRLMPVKDAVIEGDGQPGDNHMIVPDLATMRDYELYHVARAADGSLTVQQVTVWDLKTGKRVSDNGCDRKLCTSADAAGLPVLAGLVRYEEVQWAVDHHLPDIGHAIRVTYKWSRTGAGGTPGWFAPPATHAAGNGGSPVVMGMRMRVPASHARPTGLSPYDTVIWNTMAKYGDVVADNGGTGYLIGDEDSRWKGNHNLSIPTGVMAAGMEVVNTGCWHNANGTKDNTGILGAPCQ